MYPLRIQRTSSRSSTTSHSSVTRLQQPSHCEALVLLLCYAHEEARIIPPIQDALRAVADCLALLTKAFKALQGIFDNIRRIIASLAGSRNDELAELSRAYLSVIYALKAVGSATDSSVEVLSSAEPDALVSIAHNPVIHFFLVRVIGSQWNDRLYALAKLSHFFQRIQADTRHIGSLTVQLQLSIEGTQERFGVTKMLEYRELISEQRWQVDQFLARTLGELEPWINYVCSTKRLIRRFDAPALERYTHAHVRPQ